MQTGTATIIVDNLPARRVSAAAARISTTKGSALSIFDAPFEEEKDLKLIKKVLASGHRTIIEHHMVNMAFDNVSVLVEQFVIEFRLASYTVKSRRYVNHAEAGFVIPETLPITLAGQYTERMEYLFDFYTRMVDEGIPKEDARFVLPYCFRSNFYCSMDAREAAHLIAAMLHGRGKRLSEVRELGRSLENQFDKIYPGLVSSVAQEHENEAVCPFPGRFLSGKALEGNTRLLAITPEAGRVVRDAVRFTGRMPVGNLSDRDIARALTKDARPRELEMVNALYAVDHISLSCLTHFARHRVLSLLVPDPAQALAGGDYVLPASIEATDGIREEYVKCFADQTAFAQKMALAGMSGADASYLALSGHEINIRISMNAREMLHFFKLRTCRRAQWEIRGVAEKMLDEASEASDIFRVFGPSCAVDGACPEGRLTCGRPYPSV